MNDTSKFIVATYNHFARSAFQAAMTGDKITAAHYDGIMDVLVSIINNINARTRDEIIHPSFEKISVNCKSRYVDYMYIHTYDDATISWIDILPIFDEIPDFHNYDDADWKNINILCVGREHFIDFIDGKYYDENNLMGAKMQ